MRSFTARELAVNVAGIARQYSAFRLRPFLPLARTQRYQLQSLQRLLAHAERAVPLYREKFCKAGVKARDLRSLADFAHFPTTSKDEVLAAYPEGALTRGLVAERCLVSKSSGSTGQVLEVVHQADQLSIQGLAMNRLLSLYGSYWPWDRFVYVYTAPYPAHSLLGAWPMHFLPTLAKAAELVRQLEQLRPTLLACYPSHLRALAEELGPKRCKALSLRAISVSSEASSKAERAELGAMFGCGVYDEYSTEELTRIAAQCRYGEYHLFEDVAYIETLDEAGRATEAVGEVVGTYLHNFAMPFIRYRQGDLARISVGGSCTCGYQFRSLSELVGRKLASFTLPSGRVLSSGFLLDASYSFLLDIGADLAGFTITQEAVDHVLIELLPGKNYRAESSAHVKQRFLELVAEPISVEVQLVSSLRRGPAGKHNPIVSKVAAR